MKPKLKEKTKKTHNVTVYLNVKEIEMAKELQEKMSSEVSVSLSDVFRVGMKEMWERRVS